MRKVLLPVIAGILILGLVGYSQDAFSAINIAHDPLPTPRGCPPFCPMNFTVANTGKNPVVVTGISVFVDQDPTMRKIQPLTFTSTSETTIVNILDFYDPLPEGFKPDPGFSPNPLLNPGEYFIFFLTFPDELEKKTLVSVTAKEVDINRSEEDQKKIKASKKIKT